MKKSPEKPKTILAIDESIESRVNDPLVQRKLAKGEAILRQVKLVTGQPVEKDASCSL